MIYFYDILFSIKAKHDVYPDGLSDNFIVEPTFESRHVLNRLGLLYKRVESGGLVIMEQIGSEENTAQLIRPIKGITGLSFLLTLKDLAILRYTKPFGKKIIIKENNSIKEVKYEANTLEEFIGRTRILYFDNLDQQGDNQYTISDRLQLSNVDQVGLDDFGSIIPNIFNYPTDTISNINAYEMKPEGQIRKFERDMENGSLKPLPTGAYWTVDTGTNENNPQMLYADSKLLGTRALGVIQVFIDENTIDEPEKQYEINFKKDIELIT